MQELIDAKRRDIQNIKQELIQQDKEIEKLDVFQLPLCFNTTENLVLELLRNRKSLRNSGRKRSSVASKLPGALRLGHPPTTWFRLKLFEKYKVEDCFKDSKSISDSNHFSVWLLI
jgi:hypothetical protein